MLRHSQLTLPILESSNRVLDDWTFNGASTRELTHCYHDYPARMIPQIVSQLLEKFGTGAKILFDPYCGTGTSLVEASIRGVDAIGTDLNPLARLIAKAKTTLVDTKVLEHEISRLTRIINRIRPDDYSATISKIDGITRLDFWFKPAVIRKLYFLKRYIDEIRDRNIRLFFEVAFSETVRESSNTRAGEFKLFRYKEEQLERYNPDVFGLMVTKLNRNLLGFRKYEQKIASLKRRSEVNIFDFNTIHGIPTGLFTGPSVDIIVTSPPYGDSHTTVAYGQYSRLSSAWLELPDTLGIDNRLMGGKASNAIREFPSKELNTALKKIKAQDEKRALEVASFYEDLEASVANVSTVIRKGGVVCYVVGNRRVKGVTLPTDRAVRRFFEENSFEYVNTFLRTIPNKRMPLKNSPSNISGALDSTMVQEYIVVLKRI